MKKSDLSEVHHSSGAGQAVLEVLAILALLLVAAGDPAPAVNEPHYLGRFKHFWDPAWCPGDLFLESPDAHLTLVLLTGWLTRWMPLAVFAWIGRLAAWTLLAVAWQRLSSRVSPARWLSVLTAALWVAAMQQLHLAGEWVVGGVESKSFAYAFVLFALRAYLDDRWNRVWVLLGIATALHVLVGGWSGLVLFAIWWLYHRRIIRLVSMAPGLALGGVVGLIGVAPPLLMNYGASPDVVAEANQIYVYERLPHHLALLSLDAPQLADRSVRHFLLLLSLAMVAWLALRRSAAALRNSDSSFAAAEGRDNTPHPAGEGDARAREAFTRLLRFAWGAAALVLLGLALEAYGWADPARAASLLRYYWYRLTDFAAPMALALLLGALLARLIQRRHSYAPALLMLLLALVTANFGQALYARYQNPIPPADRRAHDYQDWVDVCRWAQGNTPSDAVFLVPRGATSFKWRAGRAEVVTWKDIPQNADHMAQWFHRVQDVYRDPQGDGERDLVRSLSHLGAERLKQLAEKYQADYALSVDYRPVSLPVAYRNATYVVYDMRSFKDP